MEKETSTETAFLEGEEIKKFEEKTQKFLSKNSLIILLILFLAVDIFFSTLAFKNQQKLKDCSFGQKTFLQKDSLQNFDRGNIPKISEIKGPRIDDEAASVERVAVCNAEKEACSTLPTGTWLFLLFAYCALLIFNLTYNFKKAVKTQWFWELLYTLLAIAAWYVWDSCGAANIWYPEFVLKTGIVIYGIYWYFFQKK